MQNFKRGGLPWVRYGSSNKVNNCFTLMHTLVLLEAKSPSCRSCYRGTLCLAGESVKTAAEESPSILAKCGTHGDSASLLLLLLLLFA